MWLFATPWTVACRVPLSMGFLRQEYWNFSSRGSSWPRNQTQVSRVSYIPRWVFFVFCFFFHHWATMEAPNALEMALKFSLNLLRSSSPPAVCVAMGHPDWSAHRPAQNPKADTLPCYPSVVQRSAAECHLRTCWKCRFPGSNLGVPNQSLHFHKTP